MNELNVYIDGHDIFFHLFAVVNLRIVMSVPVPPPLHCTERGGEEEERRGEEERRRGGEEVERRGGEEERWRAVLACAAIISHLTLLSPLYYWCGGASIG